MLQRLFGTSTSPQSPPPPSPVVQTELRHQVLWIRLNRPGKLNAINDETYEALIGALNGAAKNPEIKIALVTGSGRYFSSGNDLSTYSAPHETFDDDK